MINDIYKTLDTIYSLPLLEQYETIMKIVLHVQTSLTQRKDSATIELSKKVMEKIHGLRYLMASNKATDIGEFDINLKKAWESLNNLIGSD